MEVVFYTYSISGELQNRSGLALQCDAEGRTLKNDNGPLPFPIVTSLSKDDFRATSGDYKNIPDNLILAKIPTKTALEKLLLPGARLVYQVQKTEEEAKIEREAEHAARELIQERKNKILAQLTEMTDENLAKIGISVK